MEKVPFTRDGLENLKIEYNNLKKIERPEIIKAISIAREHGDLSENAEYQYAKEQQSLIEGRISDLESTISRAEIIDVKNMTGEDIKFGATVEIEDDESGKKQTYQIVGEYESDIENKKISITSPLARALIGKSKADNVEVNSPKGIKSYTIISVKYTWILIIQKSGQ